MIIEELLKEYSLLVGYCVVGDDRAIRWMKWLGAQFTEVDGTKVKFVIRNSHG